eukprot:scaffold21110_cov145-Isochrysis_galbana.AAC.3
MADGGEGIRRNGGDAMRHNRWSVRVTVKRASPREDSPKAIFVPAPPKLDLPGLTASTGHRAEWSRASCCEAAQAGCELRLDQPLLL